MMLEDDPEKARKWEVRPRSSSPPGTPGGVLLLCRIFFSLIIATRAQETDAEAVESEDEVCQDEDEMRTTH